MNPSIEVAEKPVSSSSIINRESEIDNSMDSLSRPSIHQKIDAIDVACLL